jgi:hypothetical protein
MKTTVGIFKDRANAERAVEQLRSIGIADRNIDLLMPGDTKTDVSDVQTTETEQPGMGKAMGGVVGAALGTAGGMSLGAAAASLFIPGVGPIIASGIIGAALLGAGGAIGGAAAGEAMEETIADGLPKDETFVYEDALRQGRSVVVALTESDEQDEAARKIMTQAGAESIDSARDNWWVGLRDAEEEDYTAQQGDFKSDEPYYRQGFEASLHPDTRDKSFDEASQYLQARHKNIYGEKSFRRGYERGQRYRKGLSEKYKSSNA